ncbi:MAG: protein kinase [Candidatus Schekmanbacteria bacterium]|nr:protein kinase [Candidatus Schekmanbacteria bacterium]
MSAQPAPLAAGPAIPATLGRYALVAELGSGPLGTVFRATAGTPPRDFALKVIDTRTAAAAAAADRLLPALMELRTLSRIPHAAAVPIEDVGAFGPFCYVAMSLLTCPSVAARLDSGAVLPRAAALAIGVRIAEALVAAHDMGGVHGCVSPSNVFVAADGRIFLTDFGAYRLRSRSSLLAPSWLAPEVLGAAGQTGQAGPGADVYGLGALLALMLRRERDHGAPTATAPQLPATATQGRGETGAGDLLARAIDEVIARAVAVRPIDRYPSMAELHRELRGLQQIAARADCGGVAANDLGEAITAEAAAVITRAQSGRRGKGDHPAATLAADQVLCPRCAASNRDDDSVCRLCGSELLQGVLDDSETGDPESTQGVARAAPDLSAGALFLGKYRITTELGRGGFGVVYRGHDIFIDRPVAIKTIRVEGAETARKAHRLALRMVRESRSAGRIVHPNVISIFDAGEIGGLSYIVMEYLAGGSLAQLLERTPSLPRRRAIEIASRVAGALGAAHALGVIHRDVKPANVLLGDGDTVKLADFGIAKALSDAVAITRPESRLGSPAYMSPEQIRGETLDGRSDLFSLAGMFYEMIAGTRPFSADSVHGIFFRILETPAPELAVPDPLREHYGRFFARALAKRPSDRYEDAGTVVRALAELAAAENAYELRVAELASVDRTAENAQVDLRDLAFPVLGIERASRQRRGVGSGDARRWRTGAMAVAVTIAAIAGLALVRWMPQDPRPLSASRTATARTTLEAATAVPDPAIAPAATATATEVPVVVVVQAELSPSPSPPAPTPSLVPRRAPPTVAATAASPGASEVAAAPPPKPGSLRVVLMPVGEIYVDGEHRGSSPRGPIELPPGEHEVLVESAIVGARVTRRVLIASGVERKETFDFRFGSLVVDVSPPAELLVDGSSRGIGAHHSLRLGLGEHDIALQAEGYRSWQGSIRISWDQPAELRRELELLAGP